MTNRAGTLWVNGEPYPVRVIDVANGPGGHGVRLEIVLARPLEPQKLGEAHVTEMHLLLIELGLQNAADLASEIGVVIAQELRAEH